MTAQYCNISPTPHLHDFTNGRPIHLTLAHLVETDPEYVRFYNEQKQKYDCKIIMDNSAFEMYKQNRDMYPSEKLIEMGKTIDADWVVMSDYPGEPAQKTIDKAIEMAPELLDAGFQTFFVPQGKVGDVEDLLMAFEWAADNPWKVRYIGVSILAVPLAFDVEKDNKLQRYLSRYRFMQMLKERGILQRIRVNGQRVHFLGAVDGPNEIELMKEFNGYIDTWDSSTAVWHGLNDILYDNTPTGLINGKLEKEVDFDFKTSDVNLIGKAYRNIETIDHLMERYL